MPETTDPNIEETRQERLRQARAAIINRSLAYLSGMFILITVIAGFFMAPEFLRTRQQHERIAELEKNVQDLEGRIAVLNAAPESTADAPVSAAFSHKIEQIENFGQNVAQLGDQIVALEQKISGVVDKLSAIESIKGELSASPQDSAAPETTTTLKGADLKAAGLLLALGQMRQSLDRQAPLESDLALLREFSSDDPELTAALDRLAPYAKSGVLSTQTLDNEFKALASDIVISELRGEDANWADKARARMENLVRIRREGNVQGTDTEAVVARAELRLDQGDIDGAMAELQSLKGPAAHAAAPWLEKAQAQSAADDLLALATQKALQQLSGSSPESLRKILELMAPANSDTTGAAPDILLDMSPQTLPAPKKLTPPKTAF